MIPALAGLQSAHDARGEDGKPLGLVHRDLSPQNLMITWEGGVKVLDFGVAKVRTQKSVTVAGLVKGKPHYMSPEQARAERIDRRSDLFSAAVVLYEAIAGRHPFHRATERDVMQAISDDPPIADEQIPKRLWKVLHKALEKDPAARFQSADEMSEALADACAPASPQELAAFLQHYRHREPLALATG